jgi:hypothetical protein
MLIERRGIPLQKHQKLSARQSTCAIWKTRIMNACYSGQRVARPTHWVHCADGCMLATSGKKVTPYTFLAESVDAFISTTSGKIQDVVAAVILSTQNEALSKEI